MRSIQVKIWSLILIILGLSLAAYKHYAISFPVIADQKSKVWLVQAKLSFNGSGGPAKVALEGPKVTPGFIVMNEDFISGKYGLSVTERSDRKIFDWALRRARGEQTLYYRLSVAASDLPQSWHYTPSFPKPVNYEEPFDSAAKTIIQTVRSASADIATFTQALISQFNNKSGNGDIELFRDRAKNDTERVQEISQLLSIARIPTRVVWMLEMANKSNHAQLQPYLQVHNGTKWLTFDPKTGRRGIPDGFLVWKVGELPVAVLEGGTDLKVNFSIMESDAELIEIAHKKADKLNAAFVKFSLFSLPIQHQNIYQLLLMVPLGALLVVFMRVFVGLSTFGTFMPILIAMAFRETQLAWGVTLFTLIVAIGLSIRFYLERLMLLLIPRLSAILVFVIIIMLVISFISNEMGTQRFLSVSLFPMVIIAMTIERMSIHWEENGPASALGHGLGSLIVAILGYIIMTNEALMFIMFVYPEMMLVILGLCLLSGRYTGYRLNELFRFSDIKDSRSAMDAPLTDPFLIEPVSLQEKVVEDEPVIPEKKP